MTEYPGKNGDFEDHGRNAYETPFGLSEEEVLLLNPRQCAELCRYGLVLFMHSLVREIFDKSKYNKTK